MLSDYIKDEFENLPENDKILELGLSVLSIAVDRRNKKMIVMGMGIINCVHYSGVSMELWNKINPLMIKGKEILEDTTAKRLELPFSSEK